MSDFAPGFVARVDAAAAVLARTYAQPVGFAPVDLIARIAASARPEERVAPRHFSPAAPGTNPTAGWDPLDPSVQETPPAAPQADPLIAAHAAGYAEGLAAAAQVAELAADRDAAMMAALVAQLSGGAGIDRDAMARRLRETVMLLVTRLVGEIGISADRLIARIDAASEALADASESAMLRVHPDDVPLIEGRLPATIFAVGDAGIARGSFVLESASTIVEDGPALWLEQLGLAIDRAPVPLARAA